MGGFPITFGWLHAIRRGQARLHRGLDVGVPNLILRSDHSVREVASPAAMQRGDAVLDVTQIARWAGCIGNRTTIVPIVDAKHDVFLSLPEPRQAAYRELDQVAGLVSEPKLPTQRLDPGKDDHRGDLRHRDHRNRFGQQHSRRSLCRQASGDLRAGHVRWHLPQRRLHPDQDVRLRRRGRPNDPECGAIRRRRPHRPGALGRHRVARLRADRPASRSAAKTTVAPRPISTCTAGTPVSGRSRPDGRYPLRTDAGDEFTAEQVVIAAGARPVIPPAIRESGVRVPHQRHHHADRRAARAPGDRRGWFRCSRIRARLLRARGAGHAW